MKFGKEFAVQMVQEWQEAYMDYNNLKSMLKGILIYFKQQNKPQSTMAAAATKTTTGKMKRRASLYRAFSGLTNRYKPVSSMMSHEDEVILVQEGGVEGLYQTMFLRSGEEGGEFV
ncbi:PHO1 homolog 3 [Hibiscus trionum]|uniref:PHO1 homolog 3 n=1 Tax=Hibiscus trionum TaxID=183268 RepID=A0A9W7MGJ8_HIBTR|nr:PHO1 homolog 3 [Hibiscus trionum]